MSSMRNMSARRPPRPETESVSCLQTFGPSRCVKIVSRFRTEGKGVMAVEHDPRSVVRQCDRLVVRLPAEQARVEALRIPLVRGGHVGP